MRLTHKNPIEVFKDISSIGIDKIELGAILILLEDGQNSFRLFEHISEIGLTATTTFEDYLKKVPAQYEELSVNSLRMNPVKDLAELKLLVPNDFALVKMTDDQSQWIFTATTTIPTGAIQNPLGTGYWSEVVTKGLRLDTVADIVELKALEVQNNSKTTVESTGDVYVFRETTTATGIASDDGKGEWLLATDKIYLYDVANVNQTDFDTLHPEPLNIDFLDVYIDGAYQNDRTLYSLFAPLNRIVKFKSGLAKKTKVRLVVRSRLN